MNALRNPVTVSYTPKDFETFKRAFECHKSQYTPKAFKALEKAMDEGWHGTVSFREWNSNPPCGRSFPMSF
jgi:hypothetical protein